MSDTSPPDDARGQSEPAPPPPAHVRGRSGFSFVWILPIVAVIVGAYLAVTTLRDRGAGRANQGQA